MRRLLAGTIAATLVVLSLGDVATARPASAPPSAREGCDPTTTTPVLGGTVPTPEDVLGFPLGSRQATNQEIGRYWRAADEASDRVVTGVYAHSWQGRPLRYALVSTPGTLEALPTIRQDLDRLRDPATPDDEAAEIIGRTPTILWIAANVHGNEPSGGDAVVRLLHELADRTDCVASEILDHAVVGLIPVQNPDGREHDTRYNSYAFDMNRDGLVGTQPEVSGRLRLLWKYPPQLFVDEHENSGRKYFFPPVADPIYHETPDGLYRQVEQIYGPANAEAFKAHGWRYETWRSGYDFFAQVYGDTVPTTQMGAVGMTFEQGDESPYPVRVRHQYTSAITTLYAGATHHDSVLRTWRNTFVQAQSEGERCRLEPNKIFNPGHQLQRRVPKRPVCGYFLLGDSRATRRVVSRLQTAHVVVDRLDHRTVVRDFRPYGEAPRRTSLPAGTYWVSLAQPQKHWVQAALNEDTYVPFPYFYDVSGWSLPLLAGIRGGATGRPVTAPVSRVPTLHVPAAPRPAGRLPRIAVLDQFTKTFNDYQYSGWLKWRLAEDWRLPYDVLQPEDVTAAALRKVDVLVVGNVDSGPVFRRLGDQGRAALRSWVARGGRYVGWQEGALLASSIGLSEVGMATPTTKSPGAMMRIRTPGGPNYIEWDSDYNLVLAPGDARVVGAFPRDMFVSGFAAKARALAGTALETVEKHGRGSVTVFGYEPNFRAVADGSARLLRKAILGTPTGSVPAPAN
ncbi:M14 family zinc carboxypeptidase [Nocardioides sp. CN2-186]|uniref:M14 family zinc carboxypeptidase n=1 Tax=Nocardioides tweenelious TaxID=3156607 RepID=UPI0032B419C6